MISRYFIASCVVPNTWCLPIIIGSVWLDVAMDKTIAIVSESMHIIAVTLVY